MKELTVYFIGYACSVSGNWLRVAAVGWMIANNFKLGSEEFGMYGGLMAIVQLLVSPIAANTIKNKSRKTILVYSNIVLFVATMVLSILCFIDRINFNIFLVLGIFLNIAHCFVTPAEDYLVKELVPADQLTIANHQKELFLWITRIISCVGAGFLISWVGLGALFLIDSLSFLVMIICLRKISTRPNIVEGSSANNVGTNPIPMIRFIYHDSTTRLICLLRYIMDSFVFISWYLIPAIIKDGQGSQKEGSAIDYGNVIGFSGVGAIIGIIMMWHIHPRKRIGAIVFFVLVLTMPIAQILVGISETVFFATFGYALSLFACIPLSVMNRQYLQTCKEPSYALSANHLAAILSILTIWGIVSLAKFFEIKDSRLLIYCCLTSIVLATLTFLSNIKETKKLLYDLFWREPTEIKTIENAA